MTTATKESKSTKKRKAAQAAESPSGEPAGTPPSIDSREARAVDLSKRMEACYLHATIGEVLEMEEGRHEDIDLHITEMAKDTVRLASGEAIAESDRYEAPDWLLAWHAPTAETCAEAKRDGAAASKAGRILDHNPFPPGTALSIYWRDAFNGVEVDDGDSSTVTISAQGQTVVTTLNEFQAMANTLAEKAKGSPPDLTNAANAAELAAKREADARADRLRQQQLAIEAAQHDMEEAVSHQAELEDQLVDMKAEMKELKASFDNAGTRARKASKALERARSGQFERTLPFPKEARPATLEVPDQDIGGKPADPAIPPKPAVDEGAFVMLDNLEKGELQEFIPGTPADIGLSEKQVELLKEKVGGDQISHLEAFQKTHGEWWTTKIDGMGKATIDKLTAAYDVVRRKFPMPDPDEPAAEAAAPAEEAVEPMDMEVATKSLDDIILMCAQVEKETTNLEGVRFVRDVAANAKSMTESLTRQEEPTTDQARAIRNWFKGVTEWHDRLEGELDAGEDDEDEDDDFGDDIEVPDANGAD